MLAGSVNPAPEVGPLQEAGVGGDVIVDDLQGACR
jgi:hypothetical protein